MQMTPEESQAITERVRRAIGLPEPERGREIGEVFSAVEAKIRRVIVRTIGNQSCDEAVVEDLVQETYQAILKRVQSANEWESFPAYCGGVAKNLTCGWIDRQRREPTGRSTPLDEVPEAALQDSDDIQFNIETKDERARLRALLRELPLHCRTAFIFVYFSDFPSNVEDAAELLEQPRASFYRKLDECKKRLRMKLLPVRAAQKGRGQQNAEPAV
jgi:RNA polymerase sigma factor (sigma-70 family)